MMWYKYDINYHIKLFSGPNELLLLTDVTLAPSCDDEATYSCKREDCRYLEVRDMETSLQILQPQLLCLMSKADDLHKCLDKEYGHTTAHTQECPLLEQYHYYYNRFFHFITIVCVLHFMVMRTVFSIKGNLNVLDYFHSLTYFQFVCLQKESWRVTGSCCQSTQFPVHLSAFLQPPTGHSLEQRVPEHWFAFRHQYKGTRNSVSVYFSKQRIVAITTQHVTQWNIFHFCWLSLFIHMV